MYKLGVIDAFKMKVIMAILMLMDHLYYFFPSAFPGWFHIVSRVVAPVFTYFVAEGMRYTSDRFTYLKKMYFVGSVMFAMMFIFAPIFGDAPSNSIIMSLAITASIIFCIDKVIEKERMPALWVLLAVFLFIVCLFFEGAMLCPIMGLIFYYLRWNRVIMCIAYIAASLGLLWLLRLLGDPQIWMLTAVVPIMLYNGKRGSNSLFAKYFFYIFYPVHIWALFIIQQII